MAAHWAGVRGLRAPFLGAGESKTFQMLPGVLISRFRHQDAGYVSVKIARRANVESIDVPAGKFGCIVYEISIDGGRSGEFFIEEQYPHRIVRWSLAPDILGELTGSARLEYWRLNENGHESYLEQIGLKSR